MQIQKLKKLENFEGIKSCPEEIEFKDFNIIFGDNGSGKSRVVRAIKTFVENGTIAKHYFYPTDPSEISFEIDGTQYTLDDSKNYTPNPIKDLDKNIAVFDKDFVLNNLSISPDEQGNKLISIAGFDLCSNLITSFEKIIEIIVDTRFNVFSTGFTQVLLKLKDGLPATQKISTRIDQISFAEFTKRNSWNAKKQIASISGIQSLISSLTILPKSDLEKLIAEKVELDTKILNFKTDKANLELFLQFTYKPEKQSLGRSKLTKSIAAYKEAISKLAELGKYSENQIEFIKLGLILLADSPNCPFCLQDITKKHTQDKLTDYKALVESLAIDAKQTFIAELKEYIQMLENIPYSDAINFIQYLTQFSLIKNLVEDKIFSIWSPIQVSITYIESLKEKLAELKSNVENDKIKSIKELSAELLDGVSSELSIINSAITSNKTKFDINKPIAQKIYDTNYKMGIASLITKRDEIALMIKEDEDKQLLKDKSSIIKHLLKNLSEIEKTDNLIESIKFLNNNFTIALVKEMDTFGNDYGSILQKYYNHFYPNGVFNYIDWSSKTTKPAGMFRYKVGISAKNTSLKDKVGRKPEEVLSEGNYNALALAYFFSINEKMNPSIIIFDDPITGMDSAKRLQLIRLMLNLFKLKQVFVFTHDVLFKSYLCDAIPEYIKTNAKDVNKNLKNTRFYNVFLSDDILKFLPNEYIYIEILSQLALIKSMTVLSELEINTAYGTLRLGLEYFLHKKLIKNIPNQDGFSERLRSYKEILDNPLEENDRITLKNIHLACSKSGPHLDSTGGDSATYLKILIQDFLTIEAKFN